MTLLYVTWLIVLFFAFEANSYDLLILANRFQFSNASPSLLPAGSFVISLGASNTTSLVISPFSVAALSPESYILAAAQKNLGQGPITIYAANGVPPNRKVTDVFPADQNVPNTGLHYACYALLERFGAAFLHPLDPYIPESVVLSTYVHPSFPIFELTLMILVILKLRK